MCFIKLTLNYTQQQQKMGTICVNESNKYQKVERFTFQRKRIEPTQSYMEKTIKAYTNFYGKPVTKETQDFIQNNYGSSYYQSTKKDGVNQIGITSYRFQVVEKLQKAHKNGETTYILKVTQVQEQYDRLYYEWHIRTRNGIVRYRCLAEFNSEKKLFKQQFTRLLNTDIPKYLMQQPKKFIDPLPSSSNNYYRPPQRFDSDAYVRQQNAAFRQRMNKQAQEWNDYARQKNNRGW